jgi:hypothetical protein
VKHRSGAWNSVTKWLINERKVFVDFQGDDEGSYSFVGAGLLTGNSFESISNFLSVCLIKYTW